MWYDQNPKEYAEYLLFAAERNDECAARKDAESKPWSAMDASHNRRQASRLRAMATLCHWSNAERAGAVDFRGLNDPTTPRDLEQATVEDIQREVAQRALESGK